MAPESAPVSPPSPPLDSGHFASIEQATDSIQPASPERPFSTLEFDPTSPRESTFKGSYYEPGHSRGPSGSSLPPYTQDAGRFSTLPEIYIPPKDETPSAEDPEANKEVAAGGFMKRRVCGLKMKAVLIIAIILLLAIIGAVVGGVVGSQKASQKAAAPDPVATAGSAETGAVTPAPTSSTPTSSTSASSSSSSSSSTSKTTQSQMAYTPMSTSDPNYLDPKTNAFTSSQWYNISLSRTYESAQIHPQIMESRWDPSTLLGTLSVVEGCTEGTYGDTVCLTNGYQHFQIRPVPPSWQNSTFKITEGKDKGTVTRLYWITPRAYGPSVRMSFVFDQNWTDLLRKRNSTIIYPAVGLRPLDVDDTGQYWYFLLASPVTGLAPQYRVYSLVGQWSFDLWSNEAELGTNEAPKLGTGAGNATTEVRDVWEIADVETIYEREGGFTWSITDAA